MSSRIAYPAAGNEWCFAVEGNSFWFRHRNRCIVDIVRRFPPPGMIYDIGGGNGVVSEALEKAGFDTILLEPGAQGVANAHARGLSRVVCARLEDAGLEPATVPSAGIFDVLEHIEDDHAFLETISSLLAPGGRIYITVPSIPFLWSADDEAAGHYRRYTRASLRMLLDRARFDVEYLTTFFLPLTPAILLARSIPTKLGWSRPPSLDRLRRDHRSHGMLGQIAELLLRLEGIVIRRGASLALGSSCLAVARVRP